MTLNDYFNNYTQSSNCRIYREKYFVDKFLAGYFEFYALRALTKSE